jgi:uncharacterized protein YegL
MGVIATTGCTDTINGQQEPSVVITDCQDGETRNPVSGECEPSAGKSDDPAGEEDPGMVDPNAKKEKFASDDPWAESDDDGIIDREDNCPFDANPDQADSDQDGIGDTCDNCLETPNPAQTDSSGQGIGDSCSPEPVGETCGELTSGFEQISPNIYLILDKSGSMEGEPLRQAKEGLDQMADELHDEVRFGFGAFPIQLACGVSMTEFLPMGQHGAATIKDSYADIVADGGTSTPDALNMVRENNLASEAGDPDDDLRSKVVVLITDGEPNSCGELPGTINAAQALQDAGIPVYVVGFNFGSNPDNLNDIAEAGGTDASGGAGDRYYTADDAGTLVTALRDISQNVIACSYKLETAPEDPDKIWVSINGEYLSSDAYTFDGGTNTLTLGDATCNELRESDPDATTLEITLGCKTACEPGEFWGCCLDDGETCETDDDCCFGACNDQGLCEAPCRPSGVTCTDNAQCCSGVCGNGTCIEG